MNQAYVADSRSVFKQCLGIGTFALSVLLGASSAQAGEYTIGIAPQQSASELAKRWGPIIKYWSETAGHTFQFRTAKDIATFQQDLSKGIYDIMFVNAHHYTVFNKDPGYVAFAHEAECANAGILVVAKEGPIQRVEQLAGASIAFSSPSAVIGTWLPAQYLETQDIAFTANFVKSMDSVYLGVAKGLFPAGGGEFRTFGGLDPEIKKQLHILWKSEFPCHPFSALPRVPQAVIQQLQQAMLGMHKHPSTEVLLKAVNIKAFVAGSDAEYRVVRNMNLKPYGIK